MLAAASTTSAQTLARPGWTGSGFKAEPWWNRAIFYELAAPSSPDTDFKAIAVRLDDLHSLHVDALILPAPQLPEPGSGAGSAMPNLDDLDDLLRRASAHGIRVLLTLQASSATTDLSGLARFWLNHGIAGLHIASPAGTSPEQTQAMIQSLRKLASGVLGQRIILSDVDLAPPSSATSKPALRAASNRSSRTSGAVVAQLQIDSRPNSLPALDAASLRPFLAQTIAQPDLLLDLHAPESSDAHPPLSEAVAAITMLIHPSALIDSRANLVLRPAPEHTEVVEQPAPKPPPPPAPPPGTYLPYVPYVPPPKPKPVVAPAPIPVDPLTNWYRQLAELHHDNVVLRNGGKTFLDLDAQNTLVWVNRPASPSPQNPPIVVLCNLSAAPVQLSLTAAMKELHLQGFFLRAVLRSDKGMGAQDIDSVALPPFAVYIGELRR